MDLSFDEADQITHVGNPLGDVLCVVHAHGNIHVLKLTVKSGELVRQQVRADRVARADTASLPHHWAAPGNL